MRVSSVDLQLVDSFLDRLEIAKEDHVEHAGAQD